MQTTSYTERLVPLIEGLSQNITEIASILKDAETATNADQTTDQTKKTSSKKSQKSSQKEAASGAGSSESKAKVTIEDVRAVLAEKSQDGLTDKVRELLDSFGAAKLSAVDPEKLPELLEAAKELK